MATGEADFTIATADAVAKYKRDGKPGADRLRGCARLYDDYVQLDRAPRLAGAVGRAICAASGWASGRRGRAYG